MVGQQLLATLKSLEVSVFLRSGLGLITKTVGAKHKVTKIELNYTYICKMESVSSPVNYLPIELVQTILQYLPTLDLMRCRRVCRGWRMAVDALTDRDEYWWRACVRDHSDTYEQARMKCHPDLTWRQLYQSLRLWTKVEDIKETHWTEICRYPEDAIGVCDINALSGSVIVQEEYKILYYNLNGELTGSFEIDGEQLQYTETETLIVYVFGIRTYGFNTEMRIIKKNYGRLDIDSTTIVPEVFYCLVVGQDVYYVPWQMDRKLICIAQSQYSYKTKMLQEFDYEIMSLGSSNSNLYVYLENGDIYQQIDDKFVNITNSSLSMLEIARRYNFINNCEEILKGICDELGRQIYGYRFYGNIAIFECFGGVVCLYNSDELIKRPKKCRPLLEFNLREKLNLKRSKKTSYLRSVAGVDVIEKENGHIILASIPKGAFAITLTH